MPKKFNKIYIQQDAIRNAVENKEEFDAWYEDGEVFLHFESKKGWSCEKDQTQIIGRMGGQVGRIKPDNRTLCYYIQYERYEYTLHTYVIGHHYYVEGMVWDLYGGFYDPPFNLVEETLTSYTHGAVHVKLVNFKDKGMCYEIHCPKLEKLRIAVASVVAIGLKETWKGLSEGEEVTLPGKLDRLKSRLFENKGFTYEDIQEMIEKDSPYTRIIVPEGRPIDHPDSRYSKMHKND